MSTHGKPAAAEAAKEPAPRTLHRRRPWSHKEMLRNAYAEAANDEAYAKEMAEIYRAFDVTVGDGLD